MDNSMYLDLSTFTRLEEIYAYAQRRNIDLHDAIRELVNSGLSHYSGPTLVKRKDT